MIGFFGSLVFCIVCGLAVCDGTNNDALYRLAAANNRLALKLLQQVKFEDGNAVLSPFSISSAFGMLYYGSRGQTARELRRALAYGYDLPDNLVHGTYSQYIKQTLQTADASYIFNSVNAILIDKDQNIIPAYKKNIRLLYNASVQDVDFRKDNQQVIQSVNSLVDQQTRGMIKHLLKQLSPDTKLLLLNAVYFKGTWKTQFNPRDTTPLPFYVNGVKSTLKNVPMMTITENFPYVATNGVQAVSLPYLGERFSMLMLLPDSLNGLKSLEQTLTQDKLSSIWRQLKVQKVLLTIPKFKLEFERDLVGDFKNLGAKALFQPGANFSGAVTSKDVFVNQILHKVVIDVNEEGSEAAAATYIGINRSAMPDKTPTFFADHPFMFAIIDRRSGMILFLGRFTNV